MSKFDKLINELCPEGVEFKELWEVAVISGAGVDKKINPDEKPIKVNSWL